MKAHFVSALVLLTAAETAMYSLAIYVRGWHTLVADACQVLGVN